MHRTRTLIFYPGLAPYRVDTFNALSERLDMRVVFMREDVAYQKYDQDKLRAQCRFDFDFMTRGPNFGIHMVRFGVGRRIRAFQPEAVACPEYGAIAQELALRKRFGAKWGMAIFSEDNAMICREDGALRTFLRRMALKRTDRLFLYTRAGRDEMAAQGLIDASRVSVSPNIQSEERFRHRLREALPIAREAIATHDLAGRRVVLFVGRLVAVKGIDRLMEAFAKATAEMPDASLVLVGEGPEEPNLRARADALGIASRTLFAGHHEGAALAAWYHTGHIFGLASHFEPYGAVVNESLLAGAPVVCSSRAGAADLIRTEAQGRVVDPYGIPAISEALRWGLSQAPPLDPDALEMRPSRMPVTFDEAVGAIVEGMQRAAEEAAR